jgi:hypothetical protein
LDEIQAADLTGLLAQVPYADEGEGRVKAWL